MTINHAISISQPETLASLYDMQRKDPCGKIMLRFSLVPLCTTLRVRYCLSLFAAEEEAEEEVKKMEKKTKKMTKETKKTAFCT